MRIPTPERKLGLPFNLTPLIDVVLQLIIFFLAASHLVRSESLQPVDLPRAQEAANDVNESPRRLVITVTRDVEYFVSGRRVPLAELEQMIAAGRSESGETFEVRIRSDRAVEYRHIEPLLLACARAGVRKVGFAVLPR